MQVFYTPGTRASRIIWLLKEAELEFDLVLVDLHSAVRSDALLTASPMGKVPAIRDGEVAMSESAAIALYIADRYAPQLAPAIDSALRGKFLYWMFFTPAVIEPVMIEHASKTKPNRFRNGWGSFDQMLTTLEAALKDNRWLLGETFSAADIMVGNSVMFMQMFEMLPESRTLTDYLDRCAEREAYKLAMALEEQYNERG